MRQYQILIIFIETLQDLFSLLTSHFEGVSLLLLKSRKTAASLVYAHQNQEKVGTLHMCSYAKRHVSVNKRKVGDSTNRA